MHAFVSSLSPQDQFENPKGSAALQWQALVTLKHMRRARDWHKNELLSFSFSLTLTLTLSPSPKNCHTWDLKEEWQMNTENGGEKHGRMKKKSSKTVRKKA